MHKKEIHVLLIEDNPGDVRLIGEMLADKTSPQFSMKHSGSLSDGLNFLSENTHDVILLDLGLPDSSGLESIMEIIKAAPMIPIVMLTGLDDEETAVSALKLGVQDYLVKGRIESSLLVRSLRYAVERKQIEEELRRHREFLMELVQERTAELQKSNEELEKEIVERKITNELLENVFSNIHVLIAYLDTDFNFIRVNSNYAKSEAKEPDFYTGKNYFDLFPNEENKVIFRNVVETGEPFFAKAKPYAHAEHPEQRMTFWDWSLKPVKEADGRGSGLVLSLIDVTDNITLYSELMRSEHLASVGKLAAGVAHEVNNPINGIINYAQMLLNKFDEESKEHDIATRIIKESDRIAGIVRSLLSFARESKEGKKPVHITEMLSDSLLLTETQLKKSGIKIEVNIHKNLPHVIAQPQHIEQVFLNLISNACYALNRKYPEAHNDKLLRISAETVTIHSNPYVRITFYDQGIGIPSAIKDKIIDPFFTTKSDSEGTGLGLSISHGIIKDHNGRIKIDSVEGKFTIIFIDLPAQN
jgi:signal transduction histidine kinase/DNA-binding response OmpR family regulator